MQSIRHSSLAAEPSGCRHRTSRADTSRRPRPRARARPGERRHAPATAMARVGFSARIGQRSKRRQRRVQQPAEPDAFALPFSPTRFMPSFQSPVPIKGRPWAPVGKALVERPRAVLEQRGGLVRNHRLEEDCRVRLAQASALPGMGSSRPELRGRRCLRCSGR